MVYILMTRCWLHDPNWSQAAIESCAQREMEDPEPVRGAQGGVRFNYDLPMKCACYCHDVFVYIYICICMCVYMYIYIYIFMYIYIYVFMYIYIYIYIYVNIYIHKCICIYGLVFRVPTPPTPPMVWVPRQHPLPFYLHAIGSISEVQPRIC